MTVTSRGGTLARHAVGSVLVALLLAFATVQHLTAQERTDGEANAHEEHHANSVGLFLGASTTTEELREGVPSSSFTVGVGYERHLSSLLGLGLKVDFAFGDFERTALLAVPLFIHPVGGLRLVAAPAVEFAVEAELQPPMMNEEPAREDSLEIATDNSFAFRVGGAYEIEVGEGWSLAPELNTDFIIGNEVTFVYGLSIDYGF